MSAPRRAAEPESPESPPRVVSLQSLHRRSSPLTLSHKALSHGLDSARRLDALEWLVQAFDTLDLADEQLFSAIGLLDRYAAASNAPIAAGPGAFALVLAAMLIALKVSGFKKDLEQARKLVVEVSGSSRPWSAVRKAELNILRRLGFRACTPTAYHLLDRLLSDTLNAPGDRSALGSEDMEWDNESKMRCSSLACFLLELCVIYDPEALYSSGRPPLLSVVSALLLSLLAHGAPRHYAQMLGEAIHLTESNRSTLTEIAEAMRNRWALEEQKSAVGGKAIVLEKWHRRSGCFDVSVPGAFDLRALTSGIQMPEKSFVPKAQPALMALPTSPKPRRLSGADLSALPTPARRSAGGPGGPGAMRLEASVARSQAPSLAPALGRGSKTKEDTKPPAVKEELRKAREEDKRHQENQNRQLSYWPLPATGDAQQEEDPLLGLTHVLNMVAPRPSAANSGGSKLQSLQAPSVAAELLVSSALRMLWPADKRKLAPKDAAATCREAASVLQEAIAQLSAAANVFEATPVAPVAPVPQATVGAGVPPVQAPKGRSTETKRRRTYAGGAPPPGGISPPVSSVLGSVVRASSTAYRHSPPVRGGLRV